MATPHVSGVVALGLAAGTLEPLIRDSDLYPNVPPLLAPLARNIGLPAGETGYGTC